MNFKKLEVSGFKSFADRLQVSFSEGITAIVGPNGCGKSNVADSIRWVLGEQSAKLLRGHSMQDVIFNGTEKRKSLSYAEVALHFDNRNKMFPLDYSEVVISRKLYRSGESEYFLNNTECRLKDIVSLLREGGMGREGYSIIGQGRIESLLSAKPEDRRAIFEEAAGVSKYKAQKRESELKLNRTTDNLTRLIDIRDEKQRHLEPLSNQAEKARKYLAYKEQLKDLDINIYLHQYEYADKAKQTVLNRLQIVLNNLDNKNKEYASTNAEFDSILSRIVDVDAKQKETNQRLLLATVDLEKRSSDERVIKEKQANAEHNVLRLLAERDRVLQEIEDTHSQIENTNASIHLLSQRLTTDREKLSTTSVQYIQAVDVVIDFEKDTHNDRTALLDTYDKLADIKSNKARLIAEKEALSTKKTEIEQEKQRINQQITESNTQLAEQVALREQLTEHKEVLLDQINTFETQAKDYLTQLSKISNEQYNINSEIHALEARLKLASSMRESNEGFVYTVKKLLQDMPNSVQLQQLIKGVVGKVLQVEVKYELAIETALGAAIQNIIVQDEQAAKELIAYLRQKKYGRATFLPLSSVKPRSIDSIYFEHLTQHGVYGVASDIVKYDSALSKAIKSLLGSTIIVDNIDIGIQIAKKCGYSFKIVSLQGDILSANGAITGGQKKEPKDGISIFGQDREYLEIEQKLTSIKKELSLLNNQKDELSIHHSNTMLNIDQIGKDIVSVDIKLAKNTQKIDTLAEDLQELESILSDITREFVVVHSKLMTLSKDIDSIERTQATIADNKQATNDEIQKRQTQYTDLLAQRDALNQSIADINITLAKQEGEYNRFMDTVDTQKRRLTLLNDTATKLAIDIEQNQIFVNNLKKEIEIIQQNSLENQKVQSIQQELNNIENQKANLLDQQLEIDKRRTVLLDELRKLGDQRTKEEAMLNKVDSDIELMEIKISDEYGLSKEDCIPFKRDIVIGAATKEQNQIKKVIADLGNINLDSIQESQVLFDEYNHFCTQIDDLEKAKADLLKIIKDLNREMAIQFDQEFQKIRQNFVQVFKELFNGGTADLVMQTNDEMTESEKLEAGIEIKAQPPEKRLQSISLLSGGERALTAIAILFAILRLKPMPFCVLDEIEAALDDANAHRFAKYLHRFSKETQFIVITHRKPTMEMADSLYGVTMEEKGVSKIVSVKLNDAIRVAETSEKSSVVGA